MTTATYWKDETLDTYLDRWATARADKPALVEAAGRYTWAALARAVERAAHGLQALGLERGSVISCQLPNWSEFVIVALAALRVGAVLNPIPPTYRGHEISFILSALESRAFVIPRAFRSHDYTAMAQELRGGLPRLETVLVARGEPGPAMRPFATLLDTAWEARAGRRPLAGTDPKDVSEVIFTSGTTGEPKGVMHTSNTALSIIYPLIERLAFTERDVALMSSTFGHQTGFLYGYCLTLLLGSTGVWLDVWNAEEAARLIEAERVTYTMGATPFLQDLTYTPALERHDTSSLRLFISAGASIPRALVQDGRRRLGCVISAGWGMSENGLVTCNGLDDPPDKVFGTDGSPLAGMELRVIDGEGTDLPSGSEGDLLVRGHSQFVGYWKRPEFTREAHTADGWFKTGDRATLDQDGYVAITGRTKDLIIRGGENISVAEIESLLFAHPKVAGVAIVAMPDPRLVERACAFVIPQPGQRVTLGELTAHLEAHRVARHKFPERLELITEFPMTPSGKIQKYRLRETITAKLAGEQRRA
ncbi:MAG: AMP-binding protein [Candidatus Rokubacteria bacterium]|nr:AMP-binding protein [Candidatus Rokubacteria bacterium]MBI3824514.1 AMP-binding protein [Candidatus Rokubacteria bacterium]